MVVWFAMAWAGTPHSGVDARLAEVAELRSMRYGTGAPTIPAEAYARAAAGHTETGLVAVPDQKAKKAWGVGIVDVPVAKLFSAINDDRNKKDYTKLSHVEVLKGGLCGTERVVFQYLPVPLITDRWWVIEQRINVPLQDKAEGKVREMSWTMVPDGSDLLNSPAQSVASNGMSVASTDGGWFLIGLDDTHTLIEFWAFSDPGGSVPVALVSNFAAGGISDTFDAMARLAKKGPACNL